MDFKKVQVFVVEDNQPVTPQLVPVTIRWVDADRAHRVTLVLVLSSIGLALCLTWAGLGPDVTLLWTLAGLVLHAFLRTVTRWYARRKLDEMRTLLEP